MKILLTIAVVYLMFKAAAAYQRQRGTTAAERELEGEIILLDIEAEIDAISGIINDLKAIEDFIIELEVRSAAEYEAKSNIKMSWTTAAGNTNNYRLNISGDSAAAEHLLNAAYIERAALRQELKKSIVKLHSRCNGNGNENYLLLSRGVGENA